MRLEALTPFTYRWPGGEVHLEPGTPIDLPDERAQRLLTKAPLKVRVCPPTIRITWQRADGTSGGPAMVDFLHTDPDGAVWAFVTLGDTWAVVNTKYVRRSGEEG
jgi:hypothetical protein